jgi:hypothetical protein
MHSFCGELHALFGGLERFTFDFPAGQISANGIYLLFEKGEPGHDTDRIVRVGTHTGDNQLPSRLRQHFCNENKDRSIFRKNIGRALLKRAGDPFLEQWEWDLTTREAREQLGPRLDRRKQQAVERQVTTYIQENFSFAVVEVREKTQRLRLESRIISTVSWCQGCRPSPGWLGLHSPKDKIRQSGLWLVNELYGEPLSEADLAGLARLAR